MAPADRRKLMHSSRFAERPGSNQSQHPPITAPPPRGVILPRRGPSLEATRTTRRGRSMVPRDAARQSKGETCMPAPVEVGPPRSQPLVWASPRWHSSSSPLTLANAAASQRGQRSLASDQPHARDCFAGGTGADSLRLQTSVDARRRRVALSPRDACPPRPARRRARVRAVRADRLCQRRLADRPSGTRSVPPEPTLVGPGRYRSVGRAARRRKLVLRQPPPGFGWRRWVQSGFSVDPVMKSIGVTLGSDRRR